MSEIDLLMVVDTKQALANSYSKDPKQPKHIKGQYMLVTGTTVNSGQGTMLVDFNAKPGDELSFRGVSIYGNSEDAVIIYDVVHWNGDTVFNRFVPNVVTRSKAAVPNTATAKGLPALQKPISFTSFDSKVRRAGKETFMINFAVYRLSADGESHELITYMQCDPVIRVA